MTTSPSAKKLCSLSALLASPCGTIVWMHCYTSCLYTTIISCSQLICPVHAPCPLQSISFGAAFMPCSCIYALCPLQSISFGAALMPCSCIHALCPLQSISFGADEHFFWRRSHALFMHSCAVPFAEHFFWRRSHALFMHSCAVPFAEHFFWRRRHAAQHPQLSCLHWKVRHTHLVCVRVCVFVWRFGCGWVS